MARCSYCDWENEADAAFCTNSDCGKFLGWTGGGDGSAPDAGLPTGANRPPPPPPPAPRGVQTPASPRPPAPPPTTGSANATSPKPVSPPPPARALPARPTGAQLPLARPTAKYQLVRPRQEAVVVERIDAPPAAPGQNGIGVNDGRQGLFMVVNQHEATVLPGGEAAFAVRVRNTGSLVERVTLGALDLPPEWVVVEPPDMKLDVAGEAIAMVRIRPPREAGVRPGATVFTMSAWSTTNPNVRCQESVRLVIAEFSETGMVAEPVTSSGKGRGQVTISLTNRGNQPVQGRLVARVDSARVEFRPSMLDIAPGATGVAEARIVPSSRLITGSPKAHLVIAGLDGNPGITPVTFTFQQQPKLSRLLAKVLTVVGALAVVAVLLVGRSLWVNRDRAVPAVVGKQQEEAVQTLKGKGFVVVSVDEGGHSEPAGQVLDQVPAPTTKAAKGAQVTIGVSTGPSKIPAPNVVGSTQAQATELLTQQQFVVVVDPPVADPAVPAGSVATQDPKPDTPLDQGSKFHIAISTGPEMYSVPSVIGLTPDAASAALSSKHMQFAIGQYVYDDLRPGTVVDQSISAGALVPDGTLVKVTVALKSGTPMPSG